MGVEKGGNFTFHLTLCLVFFCLLTTCIPYLLVVVSYKLHFGSVKKMSRLGILPKKLCFGKLGI